MAPCNINPFSKKQFVFRANPDPIGTTSSVTGPSSPAMAGYAGQAGALLPTRRETMAPLSIA